MRSSSYAPPRVAKVGGANAEHISDHLDNYETIRINQLVASPADRPTESELLILTALWELGPASVHEVHRRLDSGSGYTSTLKLMQIMHAKGLLSRQRAGRQHIYQPLDSAQQTQRRIAGDLLRRAFGGSVRKLLVAALAAERTSRAELQELRVLIDQVEASRKAPEKK